jgi:acid phosphatase type 7
MAARYQRYACIIFFGGAICAENFAAPLFTYLVCSDTPQTSIHVYFHTDAEAPSVVRFDSVSQGGAPGSYSVEVEAEVSTVPGLDVHVNRYVYLATLTGLEANRRYYYVAGAETSGFSREYSFRTLPADDQAIRLVTGGDMGTSETARSLLAQAAASAPDLALIGGDIAYANGRLASWELWDSCLSNWQEFMIRPDGCQIPMVLAIGNHEVDGGFNGSRDGAPFFFAYFKQHPDERTYFSMPLTISTQLYVLDSGPDLTP